MIKTKVILLALSIFILQCSKDEVKLNTIKIKIGEKPLELTPSYHKENEDYNLDNISVKVKSDDLLNKMFDIEFEGNYSEVVKFSPYQPGAYNIDLIVEDDDSGEELEVTKYQINVSGEPISKKTFIDCAGVPNGNAIEDQCGICNGDNRSCDELIIADPFNCNDNNYHYYIQVNAWTKEEDAIKEINIFNRKDNQPFKEEHNGMWRVRFGPFNSKEYALEKVEDLNITSPWIDNVLCVPENIQEEKKEIEVEEMINYEDPEDYATPTNANQYFIQITTSSSLEKIDENKKYLESYGYKPFIKETIGRNNQVWYKLKLGPYDKESAEKTSDQIFETLGLEVRINND